MNIPLFTQWHKEGILSDASLNNITGKEKGKLFSVHWEIKTLLYLAVLMLSGGLGILVYKNIDTIGHQVILALIAGICAVCFYYCFKHKRPFSTRKVEAPNTLFEYLLLLACLTFIIFIAYLQYQYTVFGNRYGLASFIPMVVLFFTAYYFDHIGILSLAITNLAAWLGITVTPLDILRANDFSSDTIIITGVLLGVLLTIASRFTKKQDLKRHFEFTYLNFGMHILYISCLAATFRFSSMYLLWFALLIATGYYFYKRALSDRSFYMILVTTLYVFIGLSYVVIQLLEEMGNLGMVQAYLGLIYFIVMGIVLVLFLIKMNKKIKSL